MQAVRRLTWALAAMVFAVVALELAGSDASLASAVGPADCDVADALAETGQVEAATRAYVQVLRQDPASACARTGLEALAPVSDRPSCAIAADLVAAGAEDEAKEVLESAIAEDDLTCAQAALASLNDDPWYEDVAGWLGGIAKAVVVLVIAFGVVALVALLVPQVRKFARRAMGAQMVVGPFGESGSEPKVAGALSALVADELARPLDDDLDAVSLDIVDQHYELSAALDDLETVDPRLAPARAVVRLIERAVGPVRWTLSGQVLAAGSAGPGIATRFLSGHRQVASSTFRAAAVPSGTSPAEEHYLPLAVATAGWAWHHAASDLEVGSASMSTTATSYAWLCAAIRAHSEDRLEDAVRLYEQALEADPQHLRARAGWAVVAAELAPDYATALTILLVAIEELEAHVGP
jgi:tetratricopeptide (TPR) repeat protein